MRFRFDPEHDELRTAVRRLLADRAGPAAVLPLLDSSTGYDPALLTRLCNELGAMSLAIPERYGGAGYGVLELGVLFEEAGRALLTGPLLASTLAAQLVLAVGDDVAATAHLPGLGTGATIGTVALAEADGRWDAAPRTRAAQSGSVWTVGGTKEFVLDAAAADLFVVSAAGPSVFLVRGDAAGVSVEPTDCVDLSRRIGRVRFDHAPATPLGAAGGAAPALSRTRDLALTLLAADQVGIAQACLELATGWAKQRVQFGRPIGSFQAIKHKLADVRLEVEAAVSASMYALWTAQHRPSELPVVARVAAYTCGEAALLAAQENIQVHGGMGATWEHPAHLYLRRAWFDRLFGGGPQDHLARLADYVDQTVLTTEGTA